MYAEVANVFLSTDHWAFHPVPAGRRHRYRACRDRSRRLTGPAYDNRRTLVGVGYEWLDIALERLLGIEPHEAQQVLAAKRRLPVPGLSTEGIPVLAIWARTNTGRALSVVVRRSARSTSSSSEQAIL